VTRNRRLRILLGPHGLARVRGDEAAVYRWDEISGVTLQGRLSLQTEHDETGQEELWMRIISGLNDTSRWTGHRALILWHADGSSVKLEDYVRDFDTLTRTVQRETLNQLWPSYLEAYRAGGSLHFGVFSAGQTGLAGVVQGQRAIDLLLDQDTHPLWCLMRWLGRMVRPHRAEPAEPLPKPGEWAALAWPWDQIERMHVDKSRLFIPLKSGNNAWLSASPVHLPNLHILLKLARDLAGIPIS
jgi:hypothetical protein